MPYVRLGFKTPIKLVNIALTSLPAYYEVFKTMNFVMRLLKLTGWMLLPLLAACSREPSEPELQQAYQDSLQQANQVAVRIGGERMQISLEQFKKLGCTKLDEKTQNRTTDHQSAQNQVSAGQPAYRCNIEVSLKLPMLGLNTQQGQMTVSKQSQGWVVIGTPE